MYPRKVLRKAITDLYEGSQTSLGIGSHPRSLQSHAPRQQPSCYAREQEGQHVEDDQQRTSVDPPVHVSNARSKNGRIEKKMTRLDRYSSEQLEAGLAELSYHLANPHLDSIIWLSQESSPDANA